MLVKGRILTLRVSQLKAKIDVWQANDEGFYDVQQKGPQRFQSAGSFSNGCRWRLPFQRWKPKFYPIPADGPVGQMLDKLGRHPYRPAHLHYILEAEGFETLITHIFDPDDPYIHSDAVFGVKESLLAKFDLIEDPDKIAEAGFDGPYFEVIHDFILHP